METNTKLQTALHITGIIITGIMKLLWYLFLIAVGVAILLTSICVEASKPNKNNYC